MTDASIYTIGGTVQAGHGAYVPRAVDDELFELCLAREFAFVLTARQMGKSSLMVRTAQRLAGSDVRTVIVDLSQIGVRLEAEAWYLGIMTAIEGPLSLDTNIYSWWQSQAHLSHSQRFTSFLENIVLKEVREPIVIFMDEIDTTLGLDFTDDFFAAVRYIHNARSQTPAFQRLSFVLIGVATPSDLIGDATRTPFNIGRRVDVDYFTRQEAEPLAAGLDVNPERAGSALDRVLDWTSGHPYLTQRLCYAIVEREAAEVTPRIVDDAVAATFFGEQATQDNNIRFVNDMLTLRAEDPVAVLTIYRDVVRGKVVRDDPQSQTISHLKLSGVVGPVGGQLAVRNRVYGAIFDLAWIKDRWPVHWIQSVPKPVLGLVAASFVAVALLGVVGVQVQTAEVERSKNRELSDSYAILGDSTALLASQRRRLLDLTDSLGVANQGLRTLSDSLRQAEQEQRAANARLEDQYDVSESLRNAVQAQFLTSDSLRSVADAANVRLSRESEISDSLRKATTEARRETLALGLAAAASTQNLLQGDPELAALLARQAFWIARSGRGDYLGPVHGALTAALNALDGSGGPEVRNIDDPITSLVFAGGRLAIGTESGHVLIEREDYHAHRLPVRGAAVSTDGLLLASAGADGNVVVYGLNGPNSEVVATHTGGAWAVAFASNGNALASVGGDFSLRLTPVSTAGDSERLSGSARARDNDAADALAAQVVMRDGVRLTAVKVSPDGSRMVVAGEDGWLWRQSLFGGQWDSPVGWDSGHGRIDALDFSPDGSRLATAGRDGHLRVWNVETWKLMQDVPGHYAPINSVAFSPDGRRIASGSSDHTVAIWASAEMDKAPIRLQGHASWVTAVAFSPDGLSVASGSRDKSVRTWKIDTLALAESVCAAIAPNRVLTRAEWSTYVGDDLEYATEIAACENIPSN